MEAEVNPLAFWSFTLFLPCPMGIGWLKKAIAIDEETVKLEAIDDEDLKPLWDSMSGTLWRKE